MSNTKILNESIILPIPIAYLANNEKLTNIDDIIEFNDVELSYDLFLNCFYDNNYKFFELNDQYNKLEELMIDNKKIKKLESKNFSNGIKVYLIDIINSKFISNKKMKVNNISKISLIKDISRYNSLLDFKIYNNQLSLEDIYTFYRQHVNRNNKKYFRIKIITDYYSTDLDENVTMSFNFLVEIPKKYRTDDYVVPDVSVPDVSAPDVSAPDVSAPDVSAPDVSAPKGLDLEENKVYSNYNKNKAIYDDLENDFKDSDSDIDDDSCLSDSSIDDNNDSDDFF